MFFDYDVHGPSKYLKGGRDEYDSMLLSVLEFCNNETEPRGKLYVSYPMVEAVWQVPMNCNGTSCLVSSSELKIYKKNISDNFALRSRPFEIDSCLYHMHRHLERIAAFCASVITDLSLDSFLLLDCALLHRLEMHLLKTHDEVLSICPIPLFLLSIGGRKAYEKIFSTLTSLDDCNCSCLIGLDEREGEV